MLICLSAFNITKKNFQTKQLIHCLTLNRGLESNPNTVYCSGKIFRCIIDDSFDCDHCDWFSLKAKQYNNFEKKKQQQAHRNTWKNQRLTASLKWKVGAWDTQGLPLWPASP